MFFNKKNVDVSKSESLSDIVMFENISYAAVITNSLILYIGL